jgi:DNA-binding transcriptional ArsR family regulator
MTRHNKPLSFWHEAQPRPVIAFALTSIYRSQYIRFMESAFTVLAEPSRRAILALLASGERSVGDLESALNLSQPSVSKHLRVLRDAGFVEVTIDAQRRVYRIRPGPLQEVDAWMAPFRRYWSAQVDALERHLDRIATPARTKRQSRKQR